LIAANATEGSPYYGKIPAAVAAFSNKTLPYIRWYDCV